MPQTLVKIGIEPPDGGRIHTVEHVPLVVRPWVQAIFTAAPESYRGVGLELDEVRDMFGMQPALRPAYFNLVLVNFGESPIFGLGAVKWAKSLKSHKLSVSGAYHLFSTAEYQPKIDREIGSQVKNCKTLSGAVKDLFSTVIIATEEVDVRGTPFAVNVLWSDGNRCVGFGKFNEAPTSGPRWYGFLG